MSLRRISEDAKLRPFLSAHFDKQNFIKNLIKDHGQSDKYLTDISFCIDDINVEIKDYISKHTDTLMSGMQDFALLADRYSTLSSSSQMLHKKVDRLKKETLEMHDAVKLKTYELERIHSASISLRILRQFVVAKSQLDHQFKSCNGNMSLDSFDTRLLGSAAKLLFEVEVLLKNENLKKIDCVKVHTTYVKDLGQQLRRKSQEKLLAALKEKNQASVASCLQIFFNLQSLPEIILLAIDVTVKNAIDISKALIDIDEIQKQYNSTLQPIVKKGNKLVSQTTTVNTNQSKLSMKEIAHAWATAIYEQACQIHVLQKVLLKKEDPTSHIRFIDVVGQINDHLIPTHQDKLNNKSNNNTHHSNILLSKGDLIALFWNRFSSSLQDVAIEKLKYNPTVAIHLYPYLRKAGLEAYESLEKLIYQDESNSLLSTNQMMTSITREESSSSSSVQSFTYENLGATYDELFLSLGFKANDSKQHVLENNHISIKKIEHHHSSSSSDSEKGFIFGLKPLKDRYLIDTLAKLNEPVLQMFPSTEGYSSAVPSKRDLQAWIKVITHEIVSASLESEINLVMAVSKESLKSIELLLSKIEDMVYTGNEIKKITSHQNVFVKNSHQDHNTQLLILLATLQDELNRLPNHILKIIQDVPGGFSFESSYSNHHHHQPSLLSKKINNYGSNYPIEDIDGRKKSGIHCLQVFLNRFIQFINRKVDKLMKEQLLLPIVDSLTIYFKSQLQLLLKENVTNITTTTTSSNLNSINSQTLDSSKSLQIFLKQLPDIFRVYIFTLPNCSVVSNAIKEIMERIMCIFISFSSLRRPMSESCKLRITTDCNLLEQTLQSLGYQTPNSNNNTINSGYNSIVEEFKSFRRLLFENLLSSDQENRTCSEILSPPSKDKIFNLNYIDKIRPNILLSFLFSSAPSLLPMPNDINPTGLNFLECLFIFSKSTSNQTILHKENFDDLMLNLKDSLAYCNEDSEVFPESYTLLYSSSNNWKGLDSQQKCWQVLQESLDIFIQRLSVSDDVSQRNMMRKWYEAILLIGGQYFGICEPTV